MLDSDTLWRIDTACRNGWPTPHETEWEGWLFRHGGGERRRVNAVSPLNGPRADPESTIAAAEVFYRNRKAPYFYYIPSIANELDTHLKARGCSFAGQTKTLLASLAADNTNASYDGIEISPVANEDWLVAHSHLVGSAVDNLDAFRETIGSLARPVAFACSRHNARIVSQAYAVIHSGFLVIEAVATAPTNRRQGLARRAVGSLMNWGHHLGAQYACLQVLADNTPALALYRQLGFDHEAYHYHYRVPPRSRWSEAKT